MDRLDILTLPLEEAWNAYKIKKDKDKEYNEIRYGIKIKFDINDYLKGRTTTKPKVGKIIIRGKVERLEEFETELEERERRIKEWLEENLIDPEPARSRYEKKQEKEAEKKQ